MFNMYACICFYIGNSEVDILRNLWSTETKIGGVGAQRPVWLDYKSKTMGARNEMARCAARTQ
jgi:hypothetical protein